jgi:hypothetical protein
MAIGHKDPALYTARQMLADICECGETSGEHEGRPPTVYAPPPGPCGASGCTCKRFKAAALVVSRPRPLKTPRRKERS